MTGYDGTAITRQAAIAHWSLAQSWWANRYGWAVNHV